MDPRLAEATLIATGDELVRTTAERMCAATGCPSQVVGTVDDARRLWRRARAVVVGTDLAPALGRTGVPRRAGVLLVGRQERAWREGVAVGATEVFALPDDDARLLDALAVAVAGGGEACVVSVVGGVGGSWASTFAAGLGLAAARRGARALLLDADPLGGGVDLVVGAEAVAGVRWPQIDPSVGDLAVDALEGVLPVHRGMAVVSCARDTGAVPPVSAALRSLARGYDLVVVDVPRRFDSATVSVFAQSTLTVVTVPGDVRAVAASRLVIDEVRRRAAAVVAVACARPGGLRSAELAAMVEVPVVASVRADRRLRAAIDAGHGPGRSRSLRRAAEEVVDLVGVGR